MQKNTSKGNDRYSVLYNIAGLSQNWDDANNFLQPSASNPNGPAHPLCFLLHILTKKINSPGTISFESTSINQCRNQLDLEIFILNIIHCKT